MDREHEMDSRDRDDATEVTRPMRRERNTDGPEYAPSPRASVQGSAQAGDALPEGYDVDALLSYLENQLQGLRAVPFMPNKRMIDIQEFLEVIADIRRAMPREVEDARGLMYEREQILSSAKIKKREIVESAESRANAALEDAEARAAQKISDAEQRATEILEAAEHEALTKISETEIFRRADEEARSMIANARAVANNRRIEMTQYTDDMLMELEKIIKDRLEDVRRSRQNMGLTR